MFYNLQFTKWSGHRVDPKCLINVNNNFASFCTKTTRDHIWLIRLFALRFCATSLFTPFYTGRWTFPIEDIILSKDNDTSWGPYSFSPAIMHAESTSVMINMMLLVIF